MQMQAYAAVDIGDAAFRSFSGRLQIFIRASLSAPLFRYVCADCRAMGIRLSRMLSGESFRAVVLRSEATDFAIALF
jgi:hypothetical protein